MENTSPQKLRGVPEMKKRFNVSEGFLRKHIHEGNLPYYKVGNRFKLYDDDVQKLIESLKCRK